MIEIIRQKVIEIAIANLPYGETTANNEGPFIRAIGGSDGDEWCALFAGYCYRKAHKVLGLPQPRWLYRGPGLEPEKGAKRLVNNLAKAGVRVYNPLEAKAGDLIAWSRGKLGWTGHVEIIEFIDSEGIVHTIGGNIGKFPSKVRRMVHDVSKERLYKIAGLR